MRVEIIRCSKLHENRFDYYVVLGDREILYYRESIHEYTPVGINEIFTYEDECFLEDAKFAFFTGDNYVILNTDNSLSKVLYWETYLYKKFMIRRLVCPLYCFDYYLRSQEV